MKKNNIIKESREYNRLIQNSKPLKYNEYLIFIEWNKEEKYQFGFSISKKICNAVNRNKIKRQLKDIIDKKNYKKGFKCIIMVRKSILEKTYEEMKNDLYYCFEKISICEGDINEK